jgi:hypothetical protein
MGIITYIMSYMGVGPYSSYAALPQVKENNAIKTSVAGKFRTAKPFDVSHDSSEAEVRKLVEYGFDEDQASQIHKVLQSYQFVVGKGPLQLRIEKNSFGFTNIIIETSGHQDPQGSANGVQEMLGKAPPPASDNPSNM